MSRRPLLIGGLALAIIIALLTATSFLQRTTARAPALASRSDSSPSATPPPSQTDDAPTSQAAPATTQCSRTLSGTQSVDIDFDGTTYPVQVHVPETADPEAPLPLVMDLHDSDSNGVFQSSISELDAVADADETGFIVARPSAATAVDTSSPLADGNWAWSIPGAPTVAGQTPPGGARDDVAFLSAVIEELTTQGCVDSQRVYLTGFSGGGRMASAYACARPDLVAAIAPVAGLRAGSPSAEDPAVIDTTACASAQGVSVTSFHGTADLVNPYDGNEDPQWGYGLDTAVQEWADLNQCAETGTEMISEHVERTAHQDCAQNAEVVSYKVSDGGHTWPGTSADLSALGTTTQEISASELMWEFFTAHPKS